MGVGHIYLPPPSYYWVDESEEAVHRALAS
jgi:hypothetical protein